ncbi:HEAT repeat domain-containing protein [Enterobacter roggenkampii]|uniref:HEAT repeat domain-containing protein n=1 Tax=Enterobacter roggenkampii TaxID=1812935 RepID=UPI002003C2C2|nr:HEAT repeat domain-containing protein [Enterobacter roggenkampii]MCK6909142.1 HEAT repeat domain-containing protein [Enterobacter roggenkampii]
MENAVVTRLVELTRKTDNKVAVSAIYALGEGGPTSREVISRLLELTNKVDSEIAAASAAALGRIFRRR